MIIFAALDECRSSQQLNMQILTQEVWAHSLLSAFDWQWDAEDVKELENGEAVSRFPDD